MKPRIARRMSVLVAGVFILPLASCGHQTQPTPTDAALTTPDGAPPQSPAKPGPLQPPPPPQPGRMGGEPGR